MVLFGNFLGSQVLLHRQREVRPALDRGVVRDHDGLPTLDYPDPGHDPGRWGLSFIDVPGREGGELEERAPGVDEPIDPLARGQLAPRAVPLDRFLATATSDERGSLAQLMDELLHPLLPARVLFVRHDVGLENRHDVSLPWRCRRLFLAAYARA